MDKNSIMLLLKSGKNCIKVSKRLLKQKGCGFFPLSERVESIQTTGLRWNMGNRDNVVKSLDWKEFVSSSNEMVDSEINVKTSNDVIFVASINNKIEAWRMYILTNSDSK